MTKSAAAGVPHLTEGGAPIAAQLRKNASG